VGFKSICTGLLVIFIGSYTIAAEVQPTSSDVIMNSWVGLNKYDLNRLEREGVNKNIIHILGALPLVFEYQVDYGQSRILITDPENTTEFAIASRIFNNLTILSQMEVLAGNLSSGIGAKLLNSMFNVDGEKAYSLWLSMLRANFSSSPASESYSYTKLNLITRDLESLQMKSFLAQLQVDQPSIFNKYVNKIENSRGSGDQEAEKNIRTVLSQILGRPVVPKYKGTTGNKLKFDSEYKLITKDLGY